MKKITKNTVLHYILILTIVTLISSALIVLTNSITRPIIETRQFDEQMKTYASLVEEIDDFQILLKTATFEAAFAFNVSDETIAVMYTINETNAYGDIKLAYSVDLMGKIVKARFLDYQQTASFKSITENNLNLFIGLNLGDLPVSSDLNAGATGSYQSLVEAFSKGKVHFETLVLSPVDPFSVLAEGYAYKEEDTQFIPTSEILKKEFMYDENNQSIGHVYTLFGSGPYQEGGDDKDIQFYVSIDSNNRILGVLVFEGEYDHTKGVFLTRILKYLESFKGQTLQTLSYDVDWKTGATSSNSKTLVDALMQALLEVVS